MPESTLEPSKILKNRYKIIKFLGRGSFGQAYLAEDIDIQLVVVVKQLSPNNTDSGNLEIANRLFKREAETLKICSHQQIPELFNYFEENEEFYLVQEFIDGYNLKEEIDGSKKWSEYRAISLLIDILEILISIHGINIIHRDIKPSNIIRRKKDNKLVLIDFGAVKEIIATSQTSTKIFSLGYAPYEQEEGKPQLNSDIYALGMTAIQALTGIVPHRFPRDTQTDEVIWRNRAQVSNELADILDKMVRHHYSQRYQSAREVVDDLARLHKVGQTLNNGRYKLERLLGGASYSQTYLATDLRRAPKCVIKQFQPPAETAQVRWRELNSVFDAGVEILHRLGEQGQIPKVLHHFTDNQSFYVVQEFIQGETLDQEIISGKLDSNKVITLLKEVLPTLSLLHQQQVIHRDINPSNLIRWQSDDKIFLLDCGWLKEICFSVVDSEGQLRVNGIVGTPGYMPEEQESGNPRLNSDIYALGITAIYALTGVHPKELKKDPNTGEITCQQEGQVPEKLRNILDRMVRSYFPSRYQSAEEILKDLQGFVPKHRPQFRFNQKVVLPLIGVGVALIVSIFGGFNYFSALQKQNQADELIKQANELLDSEKLDEALNLCEQAEKIKADYARVFKCQGDIFLRQERYDKALIFYHKASQIQPNNSKFLNNQGNTLYKLERYKEALEVHEQALKIEPQNPNSWDGKGLALIGLGKYEQALAAFEQAIKIDDKQPRFWENKAIALKGLQRPSEVRRSYQEALDIYKDSLYKQPNNIKALVSQGQILVEFKEYKEALENYEKALIIYPESFDAWLSKANILHLLKRNEESIAACNRAIKIRPNSYIALHNCGFFLEQQEQLDQAIVFYEKALKINPKFYNAWLGRGNALTEKKHYQEAIYSFQQAIDIKPDDYKSLAARGETLILMGKRDGDRTRYEEAITSLDKALSLSPNDSYAYYQRGLAKEALGRYKEALIDYNKSIKIDPHYPDTIKAIKRLS